MSDAGLTDNLPNTDVTVGGPSGAQSNLTGLNQTGKQGPVKRLWGAVLKIMGLLDTKRSKLVLAVIIVLCIGFGAYGVRDVLRLSSAGTYPDPANFDSPYGFTNRSQPGGKFGNGINSELISEYKTLNIHWIRDQMMWDTAETSPGVYNWSQVDQQVALANQNGIHIVYVIQKAPAWHNTQVCPADGTHFRFGANDITQFATALAQRYNGNNGHGYIDAYEIGNEDFDNYWNASIGSASLQCRDPKFYVPVLEAGYKAIKAQSPTALVGMFGMWYESVSFETSFLNGMYTIDPNVGKYMDYGNFHFYNGNYPPDKVPQPDHPTFNQRWQIMHTIFEAHGDHNKPIWVTEVGWDDTDPALQNQSLQYVMDQSRMSGVVKKVFWYTINWDAVKDIQPGDRNNPPAFNPLPAFNTYQAYVAQYPTWGASGGTAPTVSLSASPASLTSGQSSTLSWSSTNATSCTASGSWSGSKPTSGSGTTGALTANATYVLSCTGNGSSASGTATVTVSTQQGSATFGHVFTIVMENHDDASIVGSSQAPYINSLIGKYGFASNYHAVGLPSEPNYLGMTAGSTFGRTSDCLVSACPDNATNIADELEKGGLTWKAYMESMGSACSATDSTLYRQKHNPFVYYTDIFTNKSRCDSHDVDYSQLSNDLNGATPNYVFITPNMQDDMHDGTIGQGDTWLKNNVPAILNSAAWKNNGLLVITWDSGLDAQGTGTPSPTILISPLSKAGFKSSTQETHYSLLRTIEDNWNLGRLGSSAGASAMNEYFTASTPPGNPSPTVSLSASPASLTSGQSSTLSWSSTNATSCTASGSWSGSKPTSGSGTTGALTASAMYTLTCTGAGGNASASASVTVNGTPPPPPPSGSSVTLDKSSHASSNGGKVASLSWSHTTSSQTNSLLIVSVSMNEPSSLQYKVSSVTYNGIALKRLATEASPGGGCWCNLELWYATTPDPGTHSVVVKLNGGNHAVAASAVSYYNVRQGTPFGALVVKKGYSANPNPALSTAVLSTPNQAAYNAWTTDNGQTFATGPGQTQLWNTNGANTAGFASTMSGGAAGGKTSTLTWKITSGSPQPFSYADIGVALNNAN